MTRKEAINRIIDHMRVHRIGDPPHIHFADALNMAIAALQDQEERENPKPLTIEELLSVNEEPVWIWFVDSPARWIIRPSSGWVDICFPERMALFNMKWYKHSAYGVDWIAYRYKPKGE